MKYKKQKLINLLAVGALGVGIYYGIDWIQAEDQDRSSMVSVCEAHPGRTDASGCHTCRTNCSNWGLAPGEYHCHNGGSTSAPSLPQSSGNNQAQIEAQKQAEEAEKQRKAAEAAALKAEQERIAKEKEAAEIEEGRLAGYAYKLAHYQHAFEDVEDKGTGNYKKGFENGFYQADEEIKETQKKAEDKGYSYKYKNPNKEIPKKIKEKEDYYLAAYSKGFDKAKSELTDTSHEAGYNKGKEDGPVLEKINTKIEVDPSHIKTVYLEAYELGYQEGEQEYFNKVSQEAADRAFNDYVSKIQSMTPSKLSTNEKGKAQYKKSYDAALADHKAAFASLESQIETAARKAGQAGEDKDNSLYKKYKEDKIYKELDQLYTSTYSKYFAEYQKKNTFKTGAGAVLIGLTGYGLYNHKKKKK